MLKSSLYDYGDAYIIVKGKLTITGAGYNAAARQVDERDQGLAFKSCTSFTNCISEINNTQIGNAKDIDVAMRLYSLIEYSDNYSKTSGSSWQYYRDELNDNLADPESRKYKIKITGKTFEVPSINCEVNLILTWSSTCVITKFTSAGTFEITDTKLYVPVVTLSTLDNSKLLQQLNSGFKRVISWNKYLSKPTLLRRNPNLNHLIEPSFQGVNRLFVLAFENDTKRTSHSGYYLPNEGFKDHNIMINGENFFDQPVKNNKVTYEYIRKIATGQEDDYATGCLLGYPYFKESYKIIEVDLCKQQALNVDSRANHLVNFTTNLDRADNTGILKKQKKLF